MVVLVLTDCPVGLRGYVTRWLLEISPGVFTGHINTRIRELLWEKTIELVKDGRAIMVYSARNEQHLQFKVHRHDWAPTDFDGVQLMMRPNSTDSSTQKHPETGLRPGWSTYSKRRRTSRPK